MMKNYLLVMLLVFVTGCVKTDEHRSIGGCSYGHLDYKGCSEYDSVSTEEIELVNNKTYTVSISGDGSSDLDLFVFDKNGVLLCSSETDVDDELCTFSTNFDKRFKYRIYRIYVKSYNKQYVNRYRYLIKFR